MLSAKAKLIRATNEDSGYESHTYECEVTVPASGGFPEQKHMIAIKADKAKKLGFVGLLEERNQEIDVVFYPSTKEIDL